MRGRGEKGRRSKGGVKEGRGRQDMYLGNVVVGLNVSFQRGGGEGYFGLGW